eukprot:2226370-Amphidinium_carterae.1
MLHKPCLVHDSEGSSAQFAANDILLRSHHYGCPSIHLECCWRQESGFSHAGKCGILDRIQRPRPRRL